MTLPTDAVRYRWEDMEQDHPMDHIDRRRIMGEKVMVSEVILHEGFSIASHQHENEQIGIVLSGKVTFGIGEGDGYHEITVVGGEVIHLPPNVPHSAMALEESRILDIFSPVSETTGVDGGKKKLKVES